MSLLIINTLEEDSPTAKSVINTLSAKTSALRIFHTERMKISPCVGCNSCWLRTPGVCALRDDCEQILKACIQCDATILISGTSLGFISYETKNIVDRMLPLVTMYTHVVDGQMRHMPRYDKKYRFGLVYSGDADVPYVEQWLERFALNFNGISMGAFPARRCEEVSLCT